MMKNSTVKMATAAVPRPLRLVYCGKRPYIDMLSLQNEYCQAKVARQKRLQRAATAAAAAAAEDLPELPDVVLAVEHSDPVYTMGRRDTSAGLLRHAESGAAPVPLDSKNAVPSSVRGVPVVQTRRGGGLTWHGPGQLTCYPIANIRRWWAGTATPNKGPSPLRWYAHEVLEGSMITTLEHYRIPATRHCVGVWCNQQPLLSPQVSSVSSAAPRKIGSVGLQLSDWVSMHGMAFNISNDLRYFDEVVMCEMADKQATSLHREMAMHYVHEGRTTTTNTVSGRPASFGDVSSTVTLPTVEEVYRVWRDAFVFCLSQSVPLHVEAVDLQDKSIDELRRYVLQSDTVTFNVPSSEAVDASLIP